MREAGEALGPGKQQGQVAVREAHVLLLAEVGPPVPSQDGAGPAVSPGPAQSYIHPEELG